MRRSIKPSAGSRTSACMHRAPQIAVIDVKQGLRMCQHVALHSNLLSPISSSDSACACMYHCAAKLLSGISLIIIRQCLTSSLVWMPCNCCLMPLACSPLSVCMHWAQQAADKQVLTCSLVLRSSTCCSNPLAVLCMHFTCTASY